MNAKSARESHEHPGEQCPSPPPLRWRFFFLHFFLLLLGVISLAQWWVPVWIVTVVFAGNLPLAGPLSAGMPLVFCGLNVGLVRTLRRIPRLPVSVRVPVQLYFAYGFTMAFCLVFLVLGSIVWGGLWLVGHSISIAGAAGSPTLARVHSVWWESVRWSSGLGLSLIIGALVYGYTRGQHQVRVTRLTLPLRNWPAAWEGLKLVHLSDLHIGPNLTTTELRGYIRQVNALEPDMIFLTGDVLDSNPAYIPEFFPLFAQLTARYGVWACLGNHDGYAGAQAVAEGFARYTQVTVLRDRLTQLSITGQPLYLAGLDDRGKDWARGLDTLPLLSHLLAAVPPDKPCILLSHRPDLFPQAARLGVTLTLSGHTHGGQLALPGWQGRFNLACFITRFARGLYEDTGHFLYVNRGLGVTGQRVRVGTPREIALLMGVPLTR